MPLMSIPGDQAFANLRANRASLWPDGRRDKVRLSGVAEVGFTPGFQIEPGEAIFTVGSCFARNIEARFVELGFDLPARNFALPAEERASETENDFLNKYPPHSILNEFRWALDPQSSYPQNGLLQLGPDQWHDPHSAPNVQPASLERVRQRRAMIADLYRRVPSCRIVVMTLGLVEAWFDIEADCYLNGAPPQPALVADRRRFRLDVLTINEILEGLSEIHSLLERYGHPDFRMLLTVSPVPFRNTFTGKDAISANTYSKSVLRAAAEMFVQAHPRVDYFPSYEIVTHTVRSSAFIQDNRHVTPQLVNVIVDRVAKAYCPAMFGSAPQQRTALKRAALEIQKAIKTKDFDRAIELYRGLEVGDRFLRAGYDPFSFRFDFGRLLLRTGATADAHAQLAQAVAQDPGSSDAVFQLARALARLQRPIEAEETFRAAVSMDPESADYRLGLANQLRERGAFDEAEQEIAVVLALTPRHAAAEAALEALASTRANRRA